MTARGPAGPASDQAQRAGTETAATAGALAGLAGAIPIIGPALVAGCLSCVGVGAAAGIGATGVLPPMWWTAGLSVTALAVAGLERHRARRCNRPARTAATVGTLIAVAAVAWIAARYALVPLIYSLTGPDSPPVDGPILP
ncbi:MAG: hypothetical protein ACRD0A_14335 [Acidimicrobiales bacterium]